MLFLFMHQNSRLSSKKCGDPQNIPSDTETTFAHIYSGFSGGHIALGYLCIANLAAILFALLTLILFIFFFYIFFLIFLVVRLERKMYRLHFHMPIKCTCLCVYCDERYSIVQLISYAREN